MSFNGLLMLAIIHPVTVPSLNCDHEKTDFQFPAWKDLRCLFIKLHKMTVKAF